MCRIFIKEKSICGWEVERCQKCTESGAARGIRPSWMLGRGRVAKRLSWTQIIHRAPWCFYARVDHRQSGCRSGKECSGSNKRRFFPLILGIPAFSFRSRPSPSGYRSMRRGFEGHLDASPPPQTGNLVAISKKKCPRTLRTALWVAHFTFCATARRDGEGSICRRGKRIEEQKTCSAETLKDKMENNASPSVRQKEGSAFFSEFTNCLDLVLWVLFSVANVLVTNLTQ